MRLRFTLVVFSFAECLIVSRHSARGPSSHWIRFGEAGASGANFQVFVVLFLNLPRHTTPDQQKVPGPDRHSSLDSRKKRLARAMTFFP